MLVAAGFNSIISLLSDHCVSWVAVQSSLWLNVCVCVCDKDVTLSFVSLGALGMTKEHRSRNTWEQPMPHPPPLKLLSIILYMCIYIYYM